MCISIASLLIIVHVLPATSCSLGFNVFVLACMRGVDRDVDGGEGSGLLVAIISGAGGLSGRRSLSGAFVVVVDAAFNSTLLLLLLLLLSLGTVSSLTPPSSFLLSVILVSSSCTFTTAAVVVAGKEDSLLAVCGGDGGGSAVLAGIKQWSICMSKLVVDA